MTAFPLLSDEQNGLDKLIRMAVKAKLGQTMKVLGRDIGGVFVTDASYRTSELEDFARAIESESRAPLLAEIERLTRSLVAAGFTDNGGEAWKPPLGPNASPLLGVIDDLRAANARMIAEVPGLLKERDELRGQVERLKADAERYQFLRDDFSPMGVNIDGNHAWAYRRNGSLKGPNLDAAIDAARAQGGEL